MLSIYMKPVCDSSSEPGLHVVSRACVVSIGFYHCFTAELAILQHLSGNFVQNKEEQQTSIPPTSPQVKDEAARRAY